MLASGKIDKSGVAFLLSKTKEAATELGKIDSLLTQISKTNDKLTSKQLAAIGERAFDTASKYGTSVADYVDIIQQMTEAGYDNAEALAELSVKAQAATTLTQEAANSFIIATDKAYGLNGSIDELSQTMDGVNNITNLNDVTMTELSEGFSAIASTAASLGVEADELTAAIATMASTTQQSGSDVADAFRTILLNIRQVVDEESGIDAEGLVKYEDACNSLGVALKETVNGIEKLRDPMEVLGELSNVYNQLGSNNSRKIDLLSSIGGGANATQLDVLLSNWDKYETMLTQFNNGLGSMAEEAKKTVDSCEGALNRLSNTWTDTIDNFVDSDLAFGAVNGLNGLLTNINEITSALGTFGTVGLTSVALISKYGTNIKNVFTNAFTSITGGAKRIAL